MPHTDVLTAPPQPARSDMSELVAIAEELLQQNFGVPFSFFDLDTLEPLPSKRARNAETDWLVNIISFARRETHAFVRNVSDLLQVLVVPLSTEPKPKVAAASVFALRPILAADANELLQWLGPSIRPNQVRHCDPQLLERLGEAARLSVLERQKRSRRDIEMKQLASQLSRNYEEITLLHRLARETRVSHGTRSLQELTLSLLSELLAVQQLVYVDAETPGVLAHGSSILSPGQCTELAQTLERRNVRAVFLDNHVQARDWAANLDGVERLVAVPVTEGAKQFGWLFALSTSQGPPLGSVEASLISTVASILATHQTNVRLFADVKDLFLGIVKALTSAIDAKDPYTCGHSERVARLARRLGQELGLQEEECQRLYLSGLLHDLGKIGIRDSVLLKPDRLTDEEAAHIREHPRIGYDILAAVKQLKPVLAGVRHHHEAYDGTGYPDRLRGEEIPLMARIISVADTYDALATDRPYRKGMNHDEIAEVLRRGAGRQWDKRVVQAFFGIQDELFAEREAAQLGRESPSLPATNAPRSSELSRLCRLVG